MKRRIAMLLTLTLALALLTPLSAMAEDEAGFGWLDYTLDIPWMTTDRDAIGMRDLPTTAFAVLVRLEPREGTLALSDVQNNQDAFTLVDADGDAWNAERFVYHTVTMDPVTNMPSISPEQEGVELLFLLEGKDEAALEGAKLSVAQEGEPLPVDLAAVPREKPES